MYDFCPNLNSFMYKFSRGFCVLPVNVGVEVTGLLDVVSVLSVNIVYFQRSVGESVFSLVEAKIVEGSVVCTAVKVLPVR